MRVSITEAGTYQHCRTEHNFTSPNRMNLEPLEPSAALFLGTQVHEALRAFYTGADIAEAYVTAWGTGMAEVKASGAFYDEAAYQKLFFLGHDMVTGYVNHYGLNPERDRDGITVLDVEREFEVRVPGESDGWFVGRFDGILSDMEGRIWVLETKTFSSPLGTPSLHQQMLGYTYAANKLAQAGDFTDIGVPAGTRVMGALYNGLRKQSPGPRVTQPLFVRRWVARTDSELEIFERTLIALYQEMSRPDLAVYPTMSRDCDWCAFLNPCLAVQSGQDPSWLLESGYRARPSRGEVYTD